MKINNIKIIARQVLLILLILVLKSKAYSQNNPEIRDGNIPFEQAIKLLEKKFNVHFYYKNEWFHNQQYNKNILDFSFEDALARIKERSNCETIIINNSIVFVTRDINSLKILEKGVKVLQIGNPNELGHNTKAIFSGRVLDGKTGEPLIGAILYVEDIKVGASTDSKGVFNLTLPIGDHNIKLSYIGYEDTYQRIKLTSSGKADLEIFEKTESIEGVYVYAESPELNITRTQMSVSKLNSKNIKELPVSIGEVDVIKSLTLLPGVQSIGEFGTGFNVRGGGSDQNLILIEDAPLFNSSHMFGLISVINADAINSVTLIKSGMPAKYGERIASIMNIKLNQPSSDKFKLNAGIGLFTSKINVEAPLWNNKVNFTFGGRTSYSDWLLKRMPDVDLMNSNALFYDLNGLLVFNLSSKNKISFFGYTSFDRFGYSTKISYQYKNVLNSINWYHYINKNFSFNLIAGASIYSYQNQENDHIKPHNAYSISSSLNYKMLKGILLFVPNNSHSIEFGLNIFHYNVNPGKLNPFGTISTIIPIQLNPDYAYETAVFLSDNVSVSKGLSVELGLRFSQYFLVGPGKEFLYADGFSRTTALITDTTTYSTNKIIQSYSDLEPRASIRYSIDGNSSLKASYCRINQYINLISNTASITPSDVWKLSNKYLKPLKSDQFALGYFRNLFSNTIETSVEVYYKKLTNILEYKNGAETIMNTNIESDLINAQGYNVGLELYIKKNTGKLGGWVSYTLSKSMRKSSGTFEDEIINGNSYFPSNHDKTHNLVVNGNYYISRRWRFAATFTYNTGRPITLPELEYYYAGNRYIYYSERNKYRLPDYNRLDVSITLGESLRVKKKWKGSWTFSVINLYGRKNAYSVYYQKSAAGNSTQEYIYNLYKLYIIGRPFPTLTYNISF